MAYCTLLSIEQRDKLKSNPKTVILYTSKFQVINKKYQGIRYSKIFDLFTKSSLTLE